MFWAWPLLGNLKPALISWPLGGSGKQAIYTELTYYHLVKLKYQNTIANMYLHTQQTRRHSLGVVFQSNIYFPFLFFFSSVLVSTTPVGNVWIFSCYVP